MGHGRGKSSTSYEKPPAPADYNVINRPGFPTTPDCQCNYFKVGTYNDQSYYSNGTFELWWDIGGQWVISTERGKITPGMWYHPTEDPLDIVAEYTECGTYEGLPIVSIGPH